MKFVIGDKVRIINYGHHIWERGEWDGKIKMIDLSPDLVGKEGIVSKATLTQGIPQYAVDGLRKHAWYNEDQLLMIQQNPNR